MGDLETLIEGSDLDGLIRRIDGLAGGHDWDGIVGVRDRCLEAVTRGKQLWGVAQFCEYRLALEAPAVYAGRVVKEGAGRFALGPLWEVAASSHTWEDLSGHITDRRLRTLAAHERGLRGETIDPTEVDAAVLEVPLRLQPWEPEYAVAAYRSDRADFPERETPGLEWAELPEAGERRGEDGGVEALLALTQPWTEQSNGRAEGVVVSGGALNAIRALGPHRVRVAQVGMEDALAVMAWTGASGGAHGRRRGSPVGRMLAWWALAGLLGLDEIEDPTALGEEAAELEWLLWDPGDQIGGWGFHLAVADPVDGLAWAVSAADAV